MRMMLRTRPAPWMKTIKPYCEAVAKAIREHDPDNIIVCGTRSWSQTE